MKRLLIIVALFFVWANMGRASSEVEKTIELEEKVELFRKMINLKLSFEMIQNSGFWNSGKEMNSMALMDTLWEKGWDSQDKLDHTLLKEALTSIDIKNFELADKVRLFLLDQKFDGGLIVNSGFIKELNDKAVEGKLQRREIYTLLNYQEHLKLSGFDKVFEVIEAEYQDDLAPYLEAESITGKSLSKMALQELVFEDIDLTTYKNGRYAFGPRMYMFCRSDRNYPCMIFMKDARNQLVMNKKGRVWTQEALGLARRGRRYNVKNGFTPTGVYTLDGVMPEANRQRVFGKYRRLIMNFIPRTSDERETKNLLPESSHDSSWWKQAIVARDIGRNLFRIHGTGLRNNNPNSTYYPFVKTSGCIAQKENRYDGVTWRDQRLLLDKMMEVSGLKRRHRNESRLRAVLYVIEIDDTKRSVEKRDIERYLDLI